MGGQDKISGCLYFCSTYLKTMRWYLSIISHFSLTEGQSWSWFYGSLTYNYLCNLCLSRPMLWVRIPLKARCTTLCDKVCQWLVAGRWFSTDPPFSYNNKTDRHDIAEMLLKVALNTIKHTSVHCCKLHSICSLLYNIE